MMNEREKHPLQYRPIILVNYLEFHDQLMTDIPYFIEQIKEWEDKVKKVNSYPWNNATTRLTNVFGESFNFLINEGHKGSFFLSIWNETGSTLVFRGTIPINLDNRALFLADAIHATERFSHGWVQCCECGENIEYQKNTEHRYFAGIYCSNCWESKWKAIEAKENYE